MIFTPFVAVVTVVAFSLGSAAKLTRLPQDVVLNYPDSHVDVNSTFELGYDETYGVVDGLQRNVTVSLSYPNGTNRVIARTSPPEGYNACPAGSGHGVLAKVNVTDIGSYTAVWNFTYGVSSDPSQANNTYCGPGPFSYETYILNKTFSVTSNEGQGGIATITTQLPQQPTGMVKLDSSADRLYLTWWSSALMLVAVAASA